MSLLNRHLLLWETINMAQIRCRESLFRNSPVVSESEKVRNGQVWIFSDSQARLEIVEASLL